jgi:hypothetical protein
MAETPPFSIKSLHLPGITDCAAASEESMLIIHSTISITFHIPCSVFCDNSTIIALPKHVFPVITEE